MPAFVLFDYLGDADAIPGTQLRTPAVPRRYRFAEHVLNGAQSGMVVGVGTLPKCLPGLAFVKYDSDHT
jgi:hypothetical protein